jgi:hypothetical protein
MAYIVSGTIATIAAGGATGAAVAAGVGAVGAATIGGIASNRAAGKAADGQNRALGASNQAADAARNDVNRLFGTADEQQQQGFTNAQDFLSGSIGRQIEPFQRGNMQAQEQVQRGLPQIQNAIMGNPVDTSGFMARPIGQPNDFNFDLSRFRQQPAAQAQQPANPNVFTNQFQANGIGQEPSGMQIDQAINFAMNQFQQRQQPQQVMTPLAALQNSNPSGRDVERFAQQAAAQQAVAPSISRPQAAIPSNEAIKEDVIRALQSTGQSSEPAIRASVEAYFRDTGANVSGPVQRRAAPTTPQLDMQAFRSRFGSIGGRGGDSASNSSLRRER